MGTINGNEVMLCWAFNLYGENRKCVHNFGGETSWETGYY
jgi:hypothetical protein